MSHKVPSKCKSFPIQGHNMKYEKEKIENLSQYAIFYHLPLLQRMNSCLQSNICIYLTLMLMPAKLCKLETWLHCTLLGAVSGVNNKNLKSEPGDSFTKYHKIVCFNVHERCYNMRAALWRQEQWLVTSRQTVKTNLIISPVMFFGIPASYLPTNFDGICRLWSRQCSMHLNML